MRLAPAVMADVGATDVAGGDELQVIVGATRAGVVPLLPPSEYSPRRVEHGRPAPRSAEESAGRGAGRNKLQGMATWLSHQAMRRGARDWDMGGIVRREVDGGGIFLNISARATSCRRAD